MFLVCSLSAQQALDGMLLPSLPLGLLAVFLGHCLQAGQALNGMLLPSLRPGHAVSILGCSF